MKKWNLLYKANKHRITIRIKCGDRAYKPGSVVNSHLSWQSVAASAQCHLIETIGPMLNVSVRCCSE